MPCYTSAVSTMTRIHPNGGDWYMEEQDLIEFYHQAAIDYAVTNGLDLVDFRDMGIVPPEDIDLAPGSGIDPYDYVWRKFEMDYTRTTCW